MSNVPKHKQQEAERLREAVNNAIRDGVAYQEIPPGVTAARGFVTHAGILIDVQSDALDVNEFITQEIGYGD